MEADSLCTAPKHSDSPGESSAEPEARVCQADAYRTPTRRPRSFPCLLPAGPAATRPRGDQSHMAQL